MSHLLNTSLIRILADNGKPVGMGFLVSARQALTCAHVVEQVGSREGATIHFDFPLLAPDEVLSGQVIFQDTRRDIDCIEVEELPQDAAPMRLVQSEELWGRTFRAFGVPHKYDSGAWASGVLRDQTTQGWLHIEDTKTTGFAVQPRFSSSPV